MRGKHLFTLLALCLLVGVVSADTAILYPNNQARVSRVTTAEYFASQLNIGSGTAIEDVANESVAVVAASTSGYFTTNRRFLQTFNITSAGIPPGSGVSSIKLRIYGSYTAADSGGLGTNVGLVITNASPTNPLSLAASDYNKFRNNSVLYSDIIPYSNWNMYGNNNFTINSGGITAIGTSGIVTLGLQNTWQTNGSFGGTWGSGKYTSFGLLSGAAAGTTYDPYLQIEYTVPDTTPPASITNLANTTTCNSVDFSWTNPVDADYYALQTYLNGTISNLLGVEYTNWTYPGLAENTEYTFSTKTRDVTGNYNLTWVNQTAITGACGSAPVADFTANETDICKGDYVQFTDLSSNTPTGWDWIFDGFNGSVEQNPVFQYNVAGLFTVNLDASNAYGNDAENKVDYINVTDCSPVADFIANDTTPCAGDTVQFTDTSTGSPNSWDWDIDGDFFDVPNPTYAFAAGTYSINLTVCNTHGCDSEYKPDYITAVDCSILPLNADFTSNVTCGNIPFNVAFTDTSTGSAITDY
jgi:PKD repeat protein